VAKPAAGWLQTVRRVVEDLSTSDVAEFELAQKEFRLRLRRNAGARPAAAAIRESAAPVGLPIVAPFTGIFYRASSPTADPYVREGDWVDAGATVGLIETMKIFNEVKAEQPGRIERVLVAAGQLVHAGDPLVLLAPGERPSKAEAAL
jgi:biotin carboxyl carrier protein